MFKQKKVLLAITISSFLAACGSSSSQDTNPPAKPNTNKQPTEKPEKPSTGKPEKPSTGKPEKPSTGKPSKPSTGKPSKPNTGKPAKPGTDNAAKTVTGFVSAKNKAQKVSGSDLNSITINNKTITLVPPSGISGGNFVNINGRIFSGTKYKESKFGVNNTATFDLYSQGYATKSMPKTGTAEYKGGAAGIFTYEDKPFSTTGDSSFTVDFGKGTVKGKLNNWGINKQYPEHNLMTDIDIDAKISGNTFSSDKTKGGFYGNDAQEMGGITAIKKDGKAFKASFGAIKE